MDLNSIRKTTKKLLDGCIVESDDGIRLFKPDGNGRYNCLWTRDFAYMVEYAGELMDKKDIYFNLKFIIDHVFEQGWIPDRVLPDGTPVYRIGRQEFPDSPVLDNGPFLIIAATSYLDMLEEDEAKKLFSEWHDVLCRGLDWLPVNDSGIITISAEKLHVGYGFTDTVKKTGAMAMETLLLWKALNLLTKWQDKCSKSSEKYKQWAKSIENSFCDCFTDENGMLYSATGICKQTDVWSSCYMISIGFPASEEQKKKIADLLAEKYDGITENGYVRHLLPGEYWEATYMEVEKNTYQNGAFWPVATGWLYDALKKYYPQLAQKAVEDTTEQFKNHGVHECICGEYTRLDTYVVSATNVYAAVKKILSDSDSAKDRR